MENKSLQEVSTRDGEPSSTDGESGGESGSGGGGVSLPLPSMSRRQTLLLAAVALALVALYLSRQGSGGGESAREAKEEVEKAAKERSVKVENDETGEVIQLPTDPEEILDMDAAIIESDVFSVVGQGDD